MMNARIVTMSADSFISVGIVCVIGLFGKMS